MATVDDIIKKSNESVEGYDPSHILDRTKKDEKKTKKEDLTAKRIAKDKEDRDNAQILGTATGLGSGAYLGTKWANKAALNDLNKTLAEHEEIRKKTGKAVPKEKYMSNMKGVFRRGNSKKMLGAIGGSAAGAGLGYLAGSKGNDWFSLGETPGKDATNILAGLGGWAGAAKLGANLMPATTLPSAAAKLGLKLGGTMLASNIADKAYTSMFGDDEEKKEEAPKENVGAGIGGAIKVDKQEEDPDALYSSTLALAKENPATLDLLKSYIDDKSADPTHRKVAQRIIDELTPKVPTTTVTAKKEPARKADMAVAKAPNTTDTPSMNKMLEDVHKNESGTPAQLEKFEDRYEEAIHTRIKNISAEVEYFRAIMSDETKSPAERQAAMREASMREDAGLSLMAIARGFDREREIRSEKHKKWQWDAMFGHPKEGGRLHAFLDTLNDIMLLMGAGGFGYNGNIEGVKLMGDSYKLGGSQEQRDRDRTELNQIIADRSNLTNNAQARYGNLEQLQLGNAMTVNVEQQMLPLKRALINAQTEQQLATITATMRANIQSAAVDNTLKMQASEFVAELENATAERRMELFDRLMASGPAGEQILKIIGGSLINNAGGVVGGTMHGIFSDEKAKNVYWQYDYSPEVGAFMDTAMGRNKKKEEPKQEEKKRFISHNRPKDTKKIMGRAAESVRGWA